MSDFTATVQRQEYQRDPKTGKSRPMGTPVKISSRTVPISEREFFAGDRNDASPPQRPGRRSKAQR